MVVTLNSGGLPKLFCFLLLLRSIHAQEFICEKPNPVNGIKRFAIGNWLLNGCATGAALSKEVEYEGYDGWFNNFARPDSGAIDRPLLRRGPAAYADGSYEPSGYNRPNPLEISEKILKGDVGTKSKTGKNALLVFFGQQIVEEILDAQRAACPPEYFNIEIPVNHSYRKQPHHTVLPFVRTRYDQRTGFSPNNPRQQLNEITPYLDGGLIYGITKQWADQLRTYSNGSIDENGKLAFSHGGLFPEYNTHRLPMANPPPPFYHAEYIKKHEIAKVSRFFKLGNPRGNENTFLLTFGILWFRWHNHIAEVLKTQNPSWSSEKIFNEARKWVIASQQQIVVYQWLPEWLGESLRSYQKYDPSVDPQIDQFFQAAAFRFGHTLVPPGVYLRDYGSSNCSIRFQQWGKNSVRTCNSFWRPQEAIKTKVNNDEFMDIDRILMGMSMQRCEREDHKIVEDLRGNVFGPLEFPRRDLMALNIQRARDHGLPDFNTIRKTLGLKPIGNFEYFKQFDVEDSIIEHLKILYKDVNKIDLWVGGILETKEGPGEVFKTIIADQFRRIRDGDRFWFENNQNNLFSNAEVARIKQLNLYDIIWAVTKISYNDIPLNPFAIPNNDSQVPISCRPLLQKDICQKKGKNFSCYYLEQLNAETLNESCVQGISYDYFNNSRVSYIITFTTIAAFVAGTFGFVYILEFNKNKNKLKLHVTMENKARATYKATNSNLQVYTAYEWMGPNLPLRSIVIIFQSDKKIEIKSQKALTLRVLDMNYKDCELKTYLITNDSYLLLKNKNDYDLILKFESDYLRNLFLDGLRHYLAEVRIKEVVEKDLSLSSALDIAVTREERQHRLEMFFRVVFAQAFKIEHSQKELLKLDARAASQIAKMELTLNEFAEVLNMQPSAEFVWKMFNLIDKDKNGFISFREFVDLLIIFAKGNGEEKVKLLFNMYDINAIGYLTQNDFVDMIKSFLETVGGNIESKVLEETINVMMKSAGLLHKEKLYFADFMRLVAKDVDKLNNARLGFKGATDNSYLNSAKSTMENIYESRDEIEARITGKVSQNDSNDIIVNNFEIKKTHKAKSNIFRIIEQKSLDIFWYSLYTLVLLAIFAERAYYYSVEREHSGLRRIAGYGVTITRGAASAMMFTYSSLLITMCRNLLTRLRDTVLHKYFPFDSVVEFHKYIAYWALAFTIMHVIGHAFNFYHISTQTADDLTCLFRNYFHATHELPKFHYWCWETMTGFTGVVATLIWIVMYIFAQPFVRKNLYNWFWYTHSLYPLFYIFVILHGTGRLIQEPFFCYFLLGPGILFSIDKLISISRKKVIIPVHNATILPSNVLMLEFRKPDNFEYKSGQWVRIACVDLNSSEYHPFTLTSSPNEATLTLHIRAVGPWTRNIRNLYDTSISIEKPLPKVYLDGPYGEGHQDWHKYNVSVLIGGGIGVTPFASILKDIVFRANLKQLQTNKKVYFIWVSRTQKQFEWLIDIIRNLEAIDHTKVVSTHIFITQFYEKFDLRTILLYICERHYQKLSKKSLFTNLEAITHFGRPNFAEFFKNLQIVHSNTSAIGVFSCGSNSMTNSVESACVKMNKLTAPHFVHTYKNF